IVLHPDQTGAPEGGVRFIMSLRATGEGHISSIEFRAGTVDREGNITLDPISRYVTLPGIVPNPSYRKKRFIIKLHEMGFENDYMTAVMAPLADHFNRDELKKSVAAVLLETHPVTQDLSRTLEAVQWLADSNYEL